MEEAAGRTTGGGRALPLGRPGPTDRGRDHNGLVLEMRLARPSDKAAAVARMVDARCDWMEARELPSWRGARDGLVTQCGTDGAVDRAAHLGVPWVRRHAQVPEVAAYDRSQGFTLVRKEQRTQSRSCSSGAETVPAVGWY